MHCQIVKCYFICVHYINMKKKIFFVIMMSIGFSFSEVMRTEFYIISFVRTVRVTHCHQEFFYLSWKYDNLLAKNS